MRPLAILALAALLQPAWLSPAIAGSIDGPRARAFLNRAQDRLPDLRSIFESAADRYDFPWTLVAALAYQESAWKPAAVGPKGAAGLMMLAPRTADMLGVSDPMDPAASIEGGVRYLARMRDRLPDSVQGRDRTWLALAAYNMGIAHLIDARALAERLGKSPDRWADIEEILPLLSEEEYQDSLRYGFARGDLTVNHVRKVQRYEDWLSAAVEDGR